MTDSYYPKHSATVPPDSEFCHHLAETAALRERVKELEGALGVCRSFLMASPDALAHVRHFCGNDCGCVLATIRAALAAGSKEGA